ncbi:MAG: S24 family peptidase [Gemmatimonadaceae bacterium]
MTEPRSSDPAEDAIPPLGPIPRGKTLSAETRAQLEWEAERLAELVGRSLASDPDSSLWQDPRFLDWFAREARAEADDTMSDDELLAAGTAFRARVHARALDLTRVTTRPPERSPLIRGVPSQVMEYAVEAGATPSVDLSVAAGVGRDIWDEPVESWVDVPDWLPKARYIAVKVTGDSMSPLMHTGDTVLVALEATVQADTVIIARHPEDGYVCKKVQRVRRGTIELVSLDPTRPMITIPYARGLILGRVVLVWCHHGEHDSLRDRTRQPG